MNQNSIKLAGCLIQDEQSRILFLHRQKGDKNQWETPGGKIDPGETPEQAAIRELKEEICVNVKIIRKIGEGNFAEGVQSYHYTWFQAEVISGTPSVMEPHTFTGLKYFSWDEIIAMYNQLSAGNQTLTHLYQNNNLTL